MGMRETETETETGFMVEKMKRRWVWRIDVLYIYLWSVGVRLAFRHGLNLPN